MVVVELILCATVMLACMFAPKLYILLSYEPVLIEYPPGYNKSSLSRKNSFNIAAAQGNIYGAFETGPSDIFEIY